jgi:hypothetical protein
MTTDPWRRTRRGRRAATHAARLRRATSRVRRGAYQTATGSADILGCHLGRFFAIETKAHNKQMTDRQELTATVMREAGGAVFLINDETGV